MIGLREQFNEVRRPWGKPAAKEIAKERSLSNDEIRTVWAALDTPDSIYASPEVARALKLILLTGQRPGEVVGMHSGEIEGDWWTIPAERAKNKREHRVFLTGAAKRIIGDKRGFFFESPRGGKPIEVNALAHVVRRNVEEPKEESAKHETDLKKEQTAEKRKIVMAAWTPHDLRRTAATKLSELGYADEIIDAVLNHKKKGIVATYNRNRYDREKQTALEAWERKLKSLTSGAGAGKVVSITTVKGKDRAAG